MNLHGDMISFDWCRYSVRMDILLAVPGEQVARCLLEPLYWEVRHCQLVKQGLDLLILLLISSDAFAIVSCMPSFSGSLFELINYSANKCMFGIRAFKLNVIINKIYYSKLSV